MDKSTIFLETLLLKANVLVAYLADFALCGHRGQVVPVHKIIVPARPVLRLDGHTE